jgi:hypothetical protein
MSTIQPHSWCHVRDDNLTQVMLRSVNNNFIVDNHFIWNNFRAKKFYFEINDFEILIFFEFSKMTSYGTRKRSKTSLVRTFLDEFI